MKVNIQQITNTDLKAKKMKSPFLNILVLAAVTALLATTMGTAGGASTCRANQAISIDDDTNEPDSHATSAGTNVCARLSKG